MATIDGNLWEYNLAKVKVVDVSDDYRLMQPPMPSAYYPVLEEVWLPSYQLNQLGEGQELVQGYLYDWHESPLANDGEWYVGVVSVSLTR